MLGGVAVVTAGLMVVPGRRISPVNNGTLSLAVEGWAGNGCEGRAGLC